jgi:hypothetical protein
LRLISPPYAQTTCYKASVKAIWHIYPHIALMLVRIPFSIRRRSRQRRRTQIGSSGAVLTCGPDFGVVNSYKSTHRPGHPIVNAQSI